METRVEKRQHGGWKAETMLDLPLPPSEKEGRWMLRITTAKDGRGRINTYASACRVKGSMVTTGIFQDFHKLVLSADKTATEKAIRTQHDEALKLKDALIAQAVAHQESRNA